MNSFEKDLNQLFRSDEQELQLPTNLLNAAKQELTQQNKQQITQNSLFVVYKKTWVYKLAAAACIASFIYIGVKDAAFFEGAKHSTNLVADSLHTTAFGDTIFTADTLRLKGF